MKKFDADDWEEWRSLPITRELMAELNGVRVVKLEEMANQAAGADERSMRATGGYAQALRMVLDLMRTKGETTDG